MAKQTQKREYVHGDRRRQARMNLLETLREFGKEGAFVGDIKETANDPVVQGWRCYYLVRELEEAGLMETEGRTNSKVHRITSKGRKFLSNERRKQRRRSKTQH